MPLGTFQRDRLISGHVPKATFGLAFGSRTIVVRCAAPVQPGNRFFFSLHSFVLALCLTSCSGRVKLLGKYGRRGNWWRNEAVAPVGGTGGAGGSNLACNVMSVGQTASLNGFVPFSSSSLWNTDISAAPLDPNSGTIISNWVGSVNVHPDWGNDPTYGIPYVVVNGSQSLVNVNLGAYGDERRSRSDAGSCDRTHRRRIGQHGRSPRSCPGQRQLFSLRAVQLRQ